MEILEGRSSISTVFGDPFSVHNRWHPDTWLRILVSEPVHKRLSCCRPNRKNAKVRIRSWSSHHQLTSSTSWCWHHACKWWIDFHPDLRGFPPLFVVRMRVECSYYFGRIVSVRVEGSYYLGWVVRVLMRLSWSRVHVGLVGCNNQFYHILVGSRWSPHSNWWLDRSTVALTLYFSDLLYSNLTDVDRLVTVWCSELPVFNSM